MSSTLSDLLKRFKGKRLQAVDQFEFCRIHIAESEVIPEGLAKGYPSSINFDEIPERIERFKQDLIDVCRKKVKSIFRENVMKVFRETGIVKANSSMGIMNWFETFQVNV
jgi:hypothetical protein